jgi:hypothetical protein
MLMKLFSLDGLERGRVVVRQDGEIVADGRLSDLQLVDDGKPDPEVAEIYVNPADAEFARAWLFCEGGC